MTISHSNGGGEGAVVLNSVSVRIKPLSMMKTSGFNLIIVPSVNLHIKSFLRSPSLCEFWTLFSVNHAVALFRCWLIFIRISKPYSNADFKLWLGLLQTWHVMENAGKEGRRGCRWERGRRNTRRLQSIIYNQESCCIRNTEALKAASSEAPTSQN